MQERNDPWAPTYSYTVKSYSGADPWGKQPYPTYQNPPKGRYSFSQRELRDIAISMGVLIAAFTIILYPGAGLPIALATASGAVLLGFFLHEMGHKFVAQKYGCLAEFRAWNMGLMIALLSATMGFLFAAPGAVYISGNVDKRRNGIISVAGPLVNLVFGLIFLGLFFVVPSIGLATVFFWVAYLNIFLGFFNMLPIPPLDGSKVLRWNPGVYAAVMGILALLFLSIRYNFL